MTFFRRAGGCKEEKKEQRGSRRRRAYPFASDRISVINSLHKTKWSMMKAKLSLKQITGNQERLPFSPQKY
jgi:hypothetical protein